MKNKSISLVLPMFNEKEYLGKTVPAALAVLESLSADFEIIIVDDASNDGSQDIADTLAAKDSRVKVVHHKINRKLGGVLKTGFSAASKEIVVYTDMDMPFDFSLLGEFLSLTDRVDIINGCRMTSERSFKRKLYSMVYNSLIRVIFGLRVEDVNFSMKIFKKEILAELDLKSEGSFISAEILVKAQYRGYKIVEVPVNFQLRLWGLSRLSSPSVVYKIIYEMVKLFPEITALRLRMAYLYAKAGMHNFVRRMTCPFAAIKKYIPETCDVYDLGCGYGLLLNFLPGFSAGKRKFIGFDVDAAKVSMARRLHRGEDAEFKLGDIADDLGIRNADCIVMIDTLLLMPFSEQEKLLSRCFDYLAPAGRLIIKDIDTRPLWKFIWHQFQETLVLKVFRLIKGKGIYCRSVRDCLGLLEKKGYQAEAIDIQKGYAYPHVLYVCSKR
jgi:glycosyltransferase involved in cell wall biosynthesis